MARRSRHHPTPLELWQTGLEAWHMTVESHMIVAMRMLGLAGVWAVAPSEKRRMVDEKAPAFTESFWAASRVASGGGRPDEVMSAALRPIRRRTRSNSRRLGRRGWTGPR